MRCSRIASLSLALAVMAVAACSDQPTAPAAPNVRVPASAHRDEMLYEDPYTIGTGASFTTVANSGEQIPTQPPVGGNAQAFSNCYNNLSASPSWVIFDKRQRLVWDDAHSPHDTVFTADVRVKARSYQGTYNGKPVRCILQDSIRVIRQPGPYLVSLTTQRRRAIATTSVTARRVIRHRIATIRTQS